MGGGSWGACTQNFIWLHAPFYTWWSHSVLTRGDGFLEQPWEKAVLLDGLSDRARVSTCCSMSGRRDEEQLFVFTGHPRTQSPLIWELSSQRGHSSRPVLSNRTVCTGGNALGLSYLLYYSKPGVLVQASNPSTWEAEASGPV